MEQLSGKQMDEKWFACKKFNIPNGRYELLSICEAESGLQIIFCDTKRHVKVFYPTQYLAYRKCDESDCWKRLAQVLTKNRECYFKENLFSIVENSEFKQWFIDGSSFNYNEEQLQHHAFVTPNEVVDVLALDFPSVDISACVCTVAE
jgi:hypothetical protein